MERYLETDESALVQATMDQMAVEDVLTGLYNRRHFLFLAGKELERSHRYRRPIALILVDLDRFNAINDRFGRACGDQAMRWVGEQIKSSLRSGDAAGRYSGEKFGVLLPATDCGEARAMAEGLCQAVAEWESPDGNHPLTASVGLVWRECGGSIPPADLLFHATQALESARRQGRNQVALQVM